MKITAGLGSIDNYPQYVKAGADEVFTGYVPYSWNSRYGNVYPLNRREVLYYNVSVGTLEDVAILYDMYMELKVPVTFTFNALYYTEEQYILICRYIKDINNIGFKDFIIADPGLIMYIYENDTRLYNRINIHLSGECMEYNTKSMELLKKYNIKRYIFHRKNTFAQMKACIDYVKQYNEAAEFEAFFMNEKCHYNGSYCNSLHCDELSHLCMVPYETGDYDSNCNANNTDIQRIADMSVKKEEADILLKETDIQSEEHTEYESDREVSESEYIPGMSGCGLCAAKIFDEIGITNLKIVGRGAYTDCMIKDIKTANRTLSILEMLKKQKNELNMQCNNEDIYDNSEFRDIIVAKMFNGRCSENCYYISNR